MHGPVGIGKSHVAQALRNLACRRNLSISFLKTSRALAHLAVGHADRTWTARLRKLAHVDLLILDDFGVRMFTDAQADDLYELITERAGHSTSYTANGAPADWYPLCPNPVVAESLLDRLVNNSHVLLMDGPSYVGTAPCSPENVPRTPHAHRLRRPFHHGNARNAGLVGSI